jgi:hypothetical protein
LKIREIAQSANTTLLEWKKKGNRHNASTMFMRRIAVVQRSAQLCHEFSRRDLGDLWRRFWIASSDEKICKDCFADGEWLASVTCDVDTKVSRLDLRAFSWSGLTLIHIPSSVEVICECCFSACKSLASVTFDSDTKVSRFDNYAFRGSGLTSIHIPSSIEVICKACFYESRSLASVTFDADLKVSQLEDNAFSKSGLTSIHIVRDR